MYHYRLKETIAAVATSPGSTIGIIRISGNQAFNIASKMTGRNSFSHMKAELLKLKSEKKALLDRCIVLPFRSPESYTGEDVVEFHVHGASLNAADILKKIFEMGAIPALRGEFTFRALLNSKMNLSEAFSINALITSDNPFTVELARKESFENSSYPVLKKFIPDWEHYFTLSTALIDFPDQVSATLPLEKIRRSIDEMSVFLRKMIKNSSDLKRFSNFSILISGKPNVGKSSLFNALLNRSRAITSDTPGTTRDYLSETLFVKGFPVIIIDSAGIHDPEAEIERQGIDRSKKLIGSCDLVLLVIDPTRPLDRFDSDLIERTEGLQRLIIENKSDVADSFHFSDSLKVSCVSGNGIEQMIHAIETLIESAKPDPGQFFFFNEWQTDTAEKTIEMLDSLRSGLESDQIELTHFFIKEILLNIRNISGEISSFDVYEKIFGSFCLGK